MFDRNNLIDQDSQDEGEAGITLLDIGRSIMIWVAMNYGRPLTVSECAVTFNAGVDIIRDAVSEIHWVLLLPDDETDPAKQFIEVDGE